MRITLLIFIVLLLFSCKEDKSVDKKVSMKVNSYLSILKNDYKKNMAINGNILKAIFFFSELTDIDSNVQYGDITVYSDYSDYKNDLNNWEKWYELNKCSITIGKLDSIENGILESTTWINEVQ